MARDVRDVQWVMPTPDRWHLYLIGGLFALYVAELLVLNLWPGLIGALAWSGFSAGFAPWQPLTRFLVQGANPLGVMFSLLILYFFLPTMDRVLERRDLGAAVLAAAVGGTVLPMAVDALFPIGGLVLGWTSYVMVLPVLFGLARPNETLLLLFFPVPARWFVWGSLILAVLFVLAGRTLGTLEGLGIWLGTYGWWHLLGPGARRRRLKAKSVKVEKDLKIRVIEGGKSKPLGRQGDEWIH